VGIAGTGSGGGAAGAAGIGVGPSGSGTTGGGAVAGTSGASPAGSHACASAQTPIVIGAVGELSGIVGGLVLHQVQTVQAWVKFKNAQGGVNCHLIRQYILADDGGDPSRNQSLVQQLIEQDHVIAFVNMTGALAGQASVNYITQKQVPVVGTEGGEAWVYDSPMFFPQQSSGALVDEGAFAALGQVGASQGKNRVATVSCIEASVCAAIYNLAPTYAPKFGLTLVYRGQGSLVQPDFTSSCQGAKSAGAQLFLIGLDANSATRIAQSCASVNYHPIFAVTSSVAQPQLASDPLLNGLVVNMPVLPWLVTSNPAIREFQQALKQYAPSLQPDATTIPGWVSAKLFEAATQHLSEPPTSESILSGLWAMNNNDLGGLTYPLTFTKGQNAPQVFCTWIVQVKDGQWSSPNGNQRICA
jgi:branched-chain amino acid transport system substrate-binding protein